MASPTATRGSTAPVPAPPEPTAEATASAPEAVALLPTAEAPATAPESTAAFQEIDTTAEPAESQRREVVLHKVVAGDTISTIAEQYDVSPQTIVAANDLTSEDDLAIDQELRVPPVSGTLHRVQEGDTLEAIAALYGTEVMPIVVMNRLDNPDSLKDGQELIVPGGSAPSRGLLASRGGQRQGPLKPGTYVVQTGDSLGSIADRFDISVETLLWANQVDDPDSIQVGDELVVLPVSGALYTVKEGDTIVSIAEKSGISADEIMMANGVDDPQTVLIGTKLLLPGGKPIRDPQPEPPKPTPTPAPTPTPQPKPVAQAAAQPAPQAAPAEPAPKPAPQPAAPPPAAPEPAPSGNLGQQTIAIAQEFIGYPYVWGGVGPRSFDCTGFVYYIFNKRLGISMPRDLWGQLGSGKRVDRANVQAGDLVFFQNTYTPGLSHVGIALDNTRFIHAASESYGVMVSRLNDSYWAARWYAASRP